MLLSKLTPVLALLLAGATSAQTSATTPPNASTTNPAPNPIATQATTPTPARPDQNPANALTPSPSGVLISSGDLIEVSVYGVPDLTQKVRISSGGDAYLNLIGYVHLNGVTIEDGQALIEKKLIDGGYLKSAHVSIFVDEYASGVSLMGEVVKPGVYPILGSRRLYDIISAAGGLKDSAGRTVTITKRDNPLAPIVVRMSSDPGEAAKANVEVAQGDTVVVSKAPVVYVVGEVNHPSGLAMDSGQSLSVMKAVALSGGTTRAAALDSAKIVRKDANGKPTEIKVELRKIMQAKASDIPLEADDVFFVPTSAAKNAATQTLGTILQIVTGVGVRHF